MSLNQLRRVKVYSDFCLLPHHSLSFCLFLCLIFTLETGNYHDNCLKSLKCNCSNASTMMFSKFFFVTVPMSKLFAPATYSKTHQYPVKINFLHDCPPSLKKNDIREGETIPKWMGPKSLTGLRNTLTSTTDTKTHIWDFQRKF